MLVNSPPVLKWGHTRGAFASSKDIFAEERLFRTIWVGFATQHTSHGFRKNPLLARTQGSTGWVHTTHLAREREREFLN